MATAQVLITAERLYDVVKYEETWKYYQNFLIVNERKLDYIKIDGRKPVRNIQ